MSTGKYIFPWCNKYFLQKNEFSNIVSIDFQLKLLICKLPDHDVPNLPCMRCVLYFQILVSVCMGNNGCWILSCFWLILCDALPHFCCLLSCHNFSDNHFNIVWVNASYYSKIAVVCNGSGENNLLFLWKYYHVVMDKVIYGTWLRGLENMLKVITISYLYDEYLRR